MRNQLLSSTVCFAPDAAKVRLWPAMPDFIDYASGMMIDYKLFT